jgi:heme oxygenase
MKTHLAQAADSLAPAKPADSLESLRASTRAAHSSIETVPALNRLLSQSLTAADYLATLRRLHAFHAGIEPGLTRALLGKSRAAALLDGHRLSAIAADIAWYGATPLPPRPTISASPSITAALGVLYVVEGSNLGGRVIGRHVAKSLGIGPGTGGSYYCGISAEDAQRRWRVLKEALSIEIDPAGVGFEPLTASALATFGALEAWMREGS